MKLHEIKDTGGGSNRPIELILFHHSHIRSDFESLVNWGAEVDVEFRNFT